MIHIERINFRSVIEQEFGDFNLTGKVQRSLTVAATCVHECRIVRDQFTKPIHNPQARRGMDVDRCTTLDRVCGQLGAALMQKSKPAGPPLALGIQIGTRVRQDIEHRAAANVHDCR